MSDLVDAFDEAVSRAEHLVPADGAAVAAARLMAQQWAAAAGDADEGLTERGKVIYAGPHFKAMLDALVMTPKARLEAAINQTDKRSKVADMKAERERRRSKSA